MSQQQQHKNKKKTSLGRELLLSDSQFGNRLLALSGPKSESRLLAKVKPMRVARF